jgi:hypothetical protein
VRHNGVVVLATPELAAALRDGLVRNPVASLGWNGPTVPLTLEDTTVLAWLRNNLGGVLTVAGGPRPTRAGGGRPDGDLGWPDLAQAATSSTRDISFRASAVLGDEFLDEVVAIFGDGAVDGVGVHLVKLTQAVDESGAGERVRGSHIRTNALTGRSVS